MAQAVASPSTNIGGPDHAGLLRQAALALHGRRPQEAERLAASVLKGEPRHVPALHVLGCALLMQGRAADAIGPLEVAARSSHDPEIETQLAVAFRLAGRSDEALSRLRRAVKRRPSYAPAFLELGNLLVARKQSDEAIGAFRRGIEVAPMMPALSVQLGYALLQGRDCAGAKIAFARALNVVPDAPDALFGMAKAYQEVGENAAAAGYFRRYLMIRPDDANAWLTYGHCLLELGQRTEGYECFRAAARGDPTRYGRALGSLAASGRGRFWLKPSAAERFLRGQRT